MKNKKIFICLFFILFLILFLSILFIKIFNKDDSYSIVKREYDTIKEESLKEAKKYDKIIEEESIENIYNYLIIDIENGVAYQTFIMDYIFERVFVKATAKEKFNLFYLYYFNMSNLEKEYTDYFSENYNLQWLNLNYNGYDLESLEGISKIKNRPLLRSIFINMKANGLKIFNNYPSMEAKFDYDLFLEKFSHILDEDYINYCKLQKESQEVVLNIGGTSFNYLGEVWYLHNYENFIKRCDNIYLKGAAQDIYEQNIALLFGQYEDDLFYVNKDTYEIDSNFIITCQQYLQLYNDDSTAVLFQKVLDLINEKREENILPIINSYINDFIKNADWLPKEPTIDNSSHYEEIEIYN